MSSNAVGSSWQRFFGWINRLWQRPGESVSTGASHPTDVREQPKKEEVAAWEDEGGAPADGATGGSAEQAAPTDLTR